MDINATLMPFLKIIYSIIVIIITLIVIQIASYILNHLKRFEKNITLIYALKDLIKYTLYVIAIIIIFSIYNIDLKGIFLSIGIVGIAVSFAAKDIISNFMAGFFLIGDKTLEVGNIMQINNLKGEVKKIGLRNTTIVTETGTTITIPNSALSTSPYLRFDKFEIKKVKINITLPLSINIEDFSADILKIIGEYDEIMKNPKATVKSEAVTNDGTNLNLQFYVKTFNKKEEYKFIITNQIRKLINKKLGDDN